jgi:hypothetical protein
MITDPKNRRHYTIKRAMVNQAKAAGCVKCGRQGHPCIFDMHHLGNKDHAIAAIGSIGIERLRRELLKCVCLCACCHRLEHFE